MVIRAKYEDGVFKPLERVKLKEGTLLYIEIPVARGRRTPVRRSGIVGMWKDRRDIRNGVSYVDRLRESAR